METLRVREAILHEKMFGSVKYKRGAIQMAKTKIAVSGGGVSLSAKEMEVLRWVQEGKTNDEIAIIIGKSKWTAKYHLKNIMKKLDVTSRVQAVSQAIGRGLLPPSVIEIDKDDSKKLNVGIVGCGRGGVAILDLFKDNPLVNVIWAADKDIDAPALAFADKLDIPTAGDYTAFLKEKVDLVINLTGSTAISEELRRAVPADTELMGGVSAKIMWQLFEERRRRVEEREQVLKEHETLYHLGLVIESIDSLKDAGYAIIDYATKLTKTPAGSLVLFDDKKEDMVLIAAKGFSANFKKHDRWDIRKGGLTSLILNQDGPLYIEDIRERENVNPVLLKEGVRTLLASPIMVEGRIVGIIYVNDFKIRKFRAEDISLFSLLTIYAGLTVDRVKSLEETRLLSITDGLTGLYNQRYLMEQLKGEIERAQRHGHGAAVIMFDIDAFKSYNDAFGHLDGNKILKIISRLLRKNSRSTDTVGRFGGEEFCVIMPHIDKEGAKIFGERVVREIREYAMPNRKVTISGGLAMYPADGKSHLSLLKKADKRLYKAKKNGRDQLVTA